jgi:hypothetical protein
VLPRRMANYIGQSHSEGSQKKTEKKTSVGGYYAGYYAGRRRVFSGTMREIPNREEQ